MNYVDIVMFFRDTVGKYTRTWELFTNRGKDGVAQSDQPSWTSASTPLSQGNSQGFQCEIQEVELKRETQRESRCRSLVHQYGDLHEVSNIEKRFCLLLIRFKQKVWRWGRGSEACSVNVCHCSFHNISLSIHINKLIVHNVEMHLSLVKLILHHVANQKYIACID